MPERMIECPRCDGSDNCPLCDDTGTIPDRRKPSETEDALRAEVKELRGLLSVLLDVIAVPGHVVTSDEWERICLLSGRYCEPYLTARIDGSYDIIALRAERDELHRMLEAALALEEPVEKALRAEVAALKAECAEAWRVHSEVVAELKAKLAKYTEPLTPMQADDISREFNGHGKLVMDMDAAIRATREGRQ